MLTFRPNNLRAHEKLVEELRGLLARLGYWSPKIFAHSTGAHNTTHQCGTLVFGTDPRTSVLDPFAGRMTSRTCSSWTRRSFLRRRR